MINFHPITDRHYHTSYDPFHAWKYEQEIRRRQQAIAEQRMEHDAFLQQRQKQQEEAFRRYQANQNALRRLQQKQQEGYQIVRDWDGQLYLVPPYKTSLDRTNNDPNEYVSDTDDNSSKKPAETYKTTKPISMSSLTNSAPSVIEKVTTVLVEDVSESEEDDDDVSAILHKTLRNRRPSPGQWIEPVEMMI